MAGRQGVQVASLCKRPRTSAGQRLSGLTHAPYYTGRGPISKPGPNCMSQAAGWDESAIRPTRGRLPGPSNTTGGLFTLRWPRINASHPFASYTGSHGSRGGDVSRLGASIVYRTQAVCCANSRVLGVASQAPKESSRGVSLGRVWREGAPNRGMGSLWCAPLAPLIRGQCAGTASPHASQLCAARSKSGQPIHSCLNACHSEQGTVIRLACAERRADARRSGKSTCHSAA